jgi:1,4-dihydroxy-2-naphthoate octaprenyltransferase
LDILLFAGFYSLIQIYQMEEDQRRGDRTLALLLGKLNVLRFAILVVGIAFAFILGEVIARYQQLCSLAVLVALMLWTVVLLSWHSRHREVDVVYEQRKFYYALWVWVVTDLGIVLAMVPA